MRTPTFTEVDIVREFELIEDEDSVPTLEALGQGHRADDVGFDEPSLLERLG